MRKCLLLLCLASWPVAAQHIDALGPQVRKYVSVSS